VRFKCILLSTWRYVHKTRTLWNDQAAVEVVEWNGFKPGNARRTMDSSPPYKCSKNAPNVRTPAEIPLSHWQYRSEVPCQSCRGREGKVSFAPLDSSKRRNSVQVPNPWQSRFCSKPKILRSAESLRPNRRSSTLSLTYVESYCYTALIRSETVIWL